jgi:hypothetical protein
MRRSEEGIGIVGGDAQSGTDGDNKDGIPEMFQLK